MTEIEGTGWFGFGRGGGAIPWDMAGGQTTGTRSVVESYPTRSLHDPAIPGGSTPGVATGAGSGAMKSIDFQFVEHLSGREPWRIGTRPVLISGLGLFMAGILVRGDRWRESLEDSRDFR